MARCVRVGLVRLLSGLRSVYGIGARVRVPLVYSTMRWQGDKTGGRRGGGRACRRCGRQVSEAFEMLAVAFVQCAVPCIWAWRACAAPTGPLRSRTLAQWLRKRFFDALRRARSLRPLRLRSRARKPCVRLRLRCEGWYSEPYVVWRTAAAAPSAPGAAAGADASGPPYSRPAAGRSGDGRSRLGRVAAAKSDGTLRAGVARNRGVLTSACGDAVAGRDCGGSGDDGDDDEAAPDARMERCAGVPAGATVAAAARTVVVPTGPARAAPMHWRSTAPGRMRGMAAWLRVRSWRPKQSKAQQGKACTCIW